MATETTSIDDILAGSIANNQPAKAPNIEQPSDFDDVSHETSDLGDIQDEYGLSAEKEPDKEPGEEQASSDNGQLDSKTSADTDEYGNEKTSARTYTQEEADEYINRTVRERIARLERNNTKLTPAQNQQLQQQRAQGFEYNSESQETWEQQLEKFVENTYYKIGQRQHQQSQQMKEQQRRAEFEERFYEGASKFKDFREVIMSLNVEIPDVVTEATRAIKNPAAFLYAAVKRAPNELKEIARMDDDKAQILAIGRLEERLKMTKPTTKTPKPVGRTREDSHAPASKPKGEPTIEQMIAQSDAKRRALNEQRRRR